MALPLRTGAAPIAHCLCALLLASCSGPSTASGEAADGRARSSPSSARARRPHREEGGSLPAGAGEGAERLPPPGPREVARRALVLRAVAEASLFPRADERTAPAALEHFESQRAHMVEWLERQGALGAASGREVAILSAPVGTLERQKVENPAGPREALVVMLWALEEISKLPSYDVPAHALPSLSRRLPPVGEPAQDFLKGARLRARKVIDRERESAEIWHWRARAREVVEQKRYPQGQELEGLANDLEEKARAASFKLSPIRDGQSFFRELIRFAAHYANARGLIPEPIGEDFPALGGRYADLSERDFLKLSQIAAERHRALNWLSGYGEDWDAVPTDT